MALANCDEHIFTKASSPCFFFYLLVLRAIQKPKFTEEVSIGHHKKELQIQFIYSALSVQGSMHR